MIFKKINVSARVDSTLKIIVDESKFSHTNAYELGAKLIAINKAEQLLLLIDNNPHYEKAIQNVEYIRINAMIEQLEKELKEL